MGLHPFQRNIDSPEQVTALCDALRESVGWDAPILIDQEGGRVQRMGPPHWPKYPSGRTYGAPARERSAGSARDRAPRAPG